MILATVVLFLLVGVSCEVLSPIPVSATSNAFTRGEKSSEIGVDLYIDLGCSDCMNDWPMLSAVYEKYASSVKFSYHLFPLPYHTWAFLLAKSAHVVNLHGDSKSDDVFNFIDYAYLPESQALIYNSATTSDRYCDIQSIVSTWVVNSTTVTADVYADAMLNDSDAEMNTRYAWKQSSLAGVSGTPMYVVNGIKVEGLTDAESWDKMFAGLLPSDEF
mgnify:FL=1